MKNEGTGYSRFVEEILFIIFIAFLASIMDYKIVMAKTSPSLTGKFPVLVFAHRGFSGVAPENTIAAFEKAIQMGADLIELDVHLSKDGVVVVIHDDTLNRTTNGRGKVVDYTGEELKRLDAGSWFHPDFAGQKIPTLEEVLNMARGRILVNVEIKVGNLGRYTIQELAERSLKVVEGALMLDQVIFSSFDYSALKQIQELNPRARVALLSNRVWTQPSEVTGGYPFSILNCRKSVLTPANIAEAHRQGIKVNVYTVDIEEEMEQFISWGIDGIITNYPDRLIRILQKRYP